MEAYRIWVGKRNFTGEGKYEIIEFTGERIGISADRFLGDMRGVNIHVFRKENGSVLIYQHDWTNHIDEEEEALILEYRDFDEAADAGFWLVLMNMRITYPRAYELDAWRAEQRKKQRKAL